MQKVKFDISTMAIIKVILALFAVWFIFTIRDIIVLFFFVLIVVAALRPLVGYMSKYIPRLLAVIILYLFLILVMAMVGYLIIPPTINQLSQLAINLPIILSHFKTNYDVVQQVIMSYQSSLFNLSSQLGRLSTGIYSTTIGFFSGIVAFITIAVLSFYMLLEEKAIDNFLLNVIPADRKEKIVEVMHKIGSKMGNWLRGQALLMLSIGITCGIALEILGIPYVFVLALWAGLTEIIPYLGPWLGLIPALIVAFTISPLTALLVVAAYLIIQQLESHFLAPKIMSKAVGLSPVIIILALLIGAKLMGILGMIIAVPLVAALSVVVYEWPNLRRINAD